MDPKTIVLVVVTPKMVPLVLGNPPCHVAVYLKHPMSWSHSSRCRAWGPSWHHHTNASSNGKINAANHELLQPENTAVHTHGTCTLRK